MQEMAIRYRVHPRKEKKVGEQFRLLIEQEIKIAEKTSGFSLKSIDINSNLGVQFVSIMVHNIHTKLKALELDNNSNQVKAAVCFTCKNPFQKNISLV